MWLYQLQLEHQSDQQMAMNMVAALIQLQPACSVSPRPFPRICMNIETARARGWMTPKGTTRRSNMRSTTPSRLPRRKWPITMVCQSAAACLAPSASEEMLPSKRRDDMDEEDDATRRPVPPPQGAQPGDFLRELPQAVRASGSGHGIRLL